MRSQSGDLGRDHAQQQQKPAHLRLAKNEAGEDREDKGQADFDRGDDRPGMRGLISNRD